MIYESKLNLKFLISLIPFLILSPHIIWLIENNFVTITYGLHRSTSDFYAGNPGVLNHFKYPVLFILKQIGVLMPFFILLLFLISKLKTKINFRDKKLIFLIFINIFPLILIFLTSLFFGINIRTMWMTPFYLFLVFIVYIFQHVNINKIKNFYLIFIFLFVVSQVFIQLTLLLKIKE